MWSQFVIIDKQAFLNKEDIVELIIANAGGDSMRKIYLKMRPCDIIDLTKEKVE